jgi:broad specificity phosphatase PhoE
MTTLTRRCVLLRHGETEWSLEGRHTGRTDLGLLPVGEAQARSLRASLSAGRFAIVLTSPLRRARETSVLAGLGDGAVVDADLAEWDYGSYEGLTTDEIRLDRPGWDLFEDGVPGGESLEDVTRRVDRVIDRIRGVEGDVACVSHAHLLRVLTARWIGLEPEVGRSLVLGPGSMSELGWEHDQPVITTWNRS